MLALTTLQQAGLTCIRFGLPILAPFWRNALRLSLGQVGLLLGAFDLGALLFSFRWVSWPTGGESRPSSPPERSSRRS